MILLQADGFYIKYLDPGYEVGQYNTLDSKLKHKLLLSAVQDLHGRIIMGFYDPRKLKNFKEAIEHSNQIIKDEVGKAIQAHLDKNNVSLHVEM